MEYQGAESDEDDGSEEAVQALMDLHLEVSELDVPGIVTIPMLVTNAELIAEVTALAQTLKIQFRPLITASTREWLECELERDSKLLQQLLL